MIALAGWERPHEAAPRHVVEEDLRIVCTSGGALTDADQASIVDGLTAAMPEFKLREYFHIRTDALRDADHIVTAWSASGAVAAILTAKRHTLEDGQPFLHIGMNLIAAPLRRTMLMKHLWRAHFERVASSGGVPHVLALRTYNPAAYVAMHTFSRVNGAAMYPVLEGRQPTHLQTLARAIASRIAAGRVFHADSGVVEQCGVPIDFYREMPESQKAVVNDYFRRHLRPGDRMLCILEVPTETGVARMLHALGCRGRKTT